MTMLAACWASAIVGFILGWWNRADLDRQHEADEASWALREYQARLAERSN